MWDTPEGELFSFQGKRLSVVDSPALPKPAQQPRPPIRVGGGGPKRTPRLTAQVGSEFNVPFASVEAWRALVDNVRATCEVEQRNPAELVYSAAQTICVGRDEGEFLRRAAAISRDPAELRDTALAGLPDEVARKLTAWTDAGCERMYFQCLDIDDLDMIELLAEIVA